MLFHHSSRAESLSSSCRLWDLWLPMSGMLVPVDWLVVWPRNQCVLMSLVLTIRLGNTRGRCHLVLLLSSWMPVLGCVPPWFGGELPWGILLPCSWLVRFRKVRPMEAVVRENVRSAGVSPDCVSGFLPWAHQLSRFLFPHLGSRHY